MLGKWFANEGSVVFIGAPAKPMPEHLVEVLRSAVRSTPEVLFAYLPQMYSKGNIDPSRQVLYLVLRDTAVGEVDRVMQALMPPIHSNWPSCEYIDAMPVFANHPWLADVLRTGCVLVVNDDESHRWCLKEAGVVPSRSGGSNA